VAGGYTGSGYTSSAELYDPSSGTWTPTTSMTGVRFYHTATLLPNGKLLAAGGYGGSSLTNTAELYDPGSATWNPVGSMFTARYEYTASLLPNGNILVAGGFNGGALADVEIYNRLTGTWAVEATGQLSPNRHGASQWARPDCGRTEQFGFFGYQHRGVRLVGGLLVVDRLLGYRSVLPDGNLVDQWASPLRGRFQRQHRICDQC
jgi:Kelch motif